MEQEKIGKYIAFLRKQKNMTQKELAKQLGISDRAVSKWERGICLMDMSLLKPLSEILEVNIIDILSGEKVEENKMNEKYEESIMNLNKLNEMKSKSFGVYGMLIVFVFIVIYRFWNDMEFNDVVGMLCMFNAFKFAHKYRLDKEKRNVVISLISFIVCLFLIVIFILNTL